MIKPHVPIINAFSQVMGYRHLLFLLLKVDQRHYLFDCPRRLVGSDFTISDSVLLYLLKLGGDEFGFRTSGGSGLWVFETKQFSKSNKAKFNSGGI